MNVMVNPIRIAIFRFLSCLLNCDHFFCGFHLSLFARPIARKTRPRVQREGFCEPIPIAKKTNPMVANPL